MKEDKGGSTNQRITPTKPLRKSNVHVRCLGKPDKVKGSGRTSWPFTKEVEKQRIITRHNNDKGGSRIAKKALRGNITKDQAQKDGKQKHVTDTIVNLEKSRQSVCSQHNASYPESKSKVLQTNGKKTEKTRISKDVKPPNVDKELVAPLKHTSITPSVQNSDLPNADCGKLPTGIYDRNLTPRNTDKKATLWNLLNLGT